MFRIEMHLRHGYNETRDEEEVETAICKEVTEKYEIIRILGHGQSGIVYLARHKTLRVLRAIKTVPRDSPSYSFLKKEAELLKELRHPGIPMIYDLMECDSHLYLIEEYVEGECLKEYICRHGRLPKRSLLHLGLDLIEPLLYLHEKNIVHLDLSPNNIMISGNKPKIIDFDHSACLHEKNPGYGSCGFASKEQIYGEKVRADMDIFAVGAILYYAAVCEKYEGDSKKLPAYLGEMGEIIKKCLAEQEKERYQSLSELKTKLQGIEPERETKRIAIVGAKAGLGVTHLSLCLAKEIGKQNRSVCIAERNLSGDMGDLARRIQKKPFDGFFFEKIHIIPYTGPCIERCRYSAEAEILDCKDDLDRAVSENPDVLLLVCSAKLWNTAHNLVAMRRILTEMKYKKEYYILFNCWEDGDRMLLPDIVRASSVFRIPYLSKAAKGSSLTELARSIIKTRAKEGACGF